MDSALIPFLIINIFAFALYGYDKLMAKWGRRRISEKTLLLVALAGASVGVGLAMLVFRHKVAKWSFLRQFLFVVVVHVAVVFLAA